MLNFIVIGSQKCGTTWLFDKLKMHPRMYFPMGKEPGYWNDNFYKGQVYRQIYNGRMNGTVVKLNNYVCGEMSTLYSIMPPEQIENLCKHHPNIKLILMVRNPVERAWSAINMHYKFNNMDISELTEEKAIKAITGAKTAKLGQYDVIIKKWLKFYQKEQLQIIFFDDIQTKYQEILRDVSKHIGIEADFFEKIPDSLLKTPSMQGQKKALSNHIYDTCIDFYRPSIHFLSHYIGRNLDDWLKTTDKKI